MKITKQINRMVYLIEIEGDIVGTHTADLYNAIHSINLGNLGINTLVLNLSKVSKIDSIGVEVINKAQEQGLKVSILNPQEVVKDMLERAMLKGRLSPFLQMVEKDRRSSQRKEFPISLRSPVSC
jgi:anti-anti-sigma factor